MTRVDESISFGMIEAIAHLIHRDYDRIVQDFVTLQIIPRGARPALTNAAPQYHYCSYFHM